jgi:hypothetical protein
MEYIRQYGEPEEIFANLYSELYELCEANKWGDPFSYARSREIYMANVLGHKIHPTYAGPDGHDSDGACEYKSTTGDEIKGTYNGISVQDTWEKQVEYLREKKIGCYKWHYFARFQGGRIDEMWKMSGEKVLELLLPKLEKQFKSEKKTKDPRLGAQLTSKMITTYGQKIDIQ